MHRQLFRFAGAGIAGFVVDAGVLYLLLVAGLGYFTGRMISFLCAVLTTWQINRRFTFSVASNMTAWQEWCRYLMAMCGGGLVNYASYSVAIMLLPETRFLPLYAVAIGSLMGMMVNFVTAKWWVFKGVI
ncbi:MAG: GtrA family protein [Pseudomonadota bacterium]